MCSFAEHHARDHGNHRNEIDGDCTAGRADAHDEGTQRDEREAGAQRTERHDRERRRPGERRAREPDDRERHGHHERHQLRPQDDRQGAVLLLERHRHVRREAVTGHGDEHQQHATRARRRAVVERGPHDEHDAGEPDGQAGDLDASRSAAQHHRRDRCGRERHGSVQHPRERRVDPLLGEGETRERNRHPRRRDEREARPARASGRSSARPGSPRGPPRRKRSASVVTTAGEKWSRPIAISRNEQPQTIGGTANIAHSAGPNS